MNWKLIFYSSIGILSLTSTVLLQNQIKSLPIAIAHSQNPINSNETLLDLGAIDSTTKPCDDFYQYACGNWIKNFELPQDQSSYTKSFDAIYHRNLEIQNEILYKYSLNNFSLPSRYAKKIGKYYSSCMNTESLEAATPEFVKKSLAEIDAISNTDQIPAAVARLHLLGIYPFFHFGPASDARDSDREIGEFSQGGLGFPNNAYYLDSVNADARQHYLHFIANIFQLAGVVDSSNQTQAIEAASTVLGIESILARSALRIEELLDPQTTHHTTDVRTLRSQLTAFDLDTYFNALGLKSIEKVNVTEPEFLKAANRLILEARLADLKTYLKWSWLHAMAPHLSEAYRQEVFAFEGNYLNGEKRMKERWKYCVSTIHRSMGEAVGEAFVNKTFGKEGKKKSQEMLQRLRDAFKNNLATVEWLDDPTRAKAIEKLEKIIPKIGYPIESRNYDDLDITDSYIQNTIRSSKFETQRLLNLIGKPVDKSAWEMPAPTVNAYYNPSWNEIVFPAGILQPPFFSKEASKGANYGAIGFVMGHELTHGFDSMGRQYDAAGNLVDWWSSTAFESFEKKAACLITQFNQYEISPNRFINGKQTLAENIADLGGLKLAFAAYQKLATAHGPQPPLGEFNETQQFFLSFAQSWCTVETPESAQLYAQTDIHAPPRYRVNGVVSNIPAFAEAFGCSRGTPMAPLNPCSMW